jgi:membrane-associated protease RseP (regulator of RpoE activity)
LQNKEDPEALINKKAYQQSVIVLAGIFMNFVLAIFIFSIVFMIGIKPIGINTQIKTEKYLRTIPTYEQAIKNGFLIKEP